MEKINLFKYGAEPRFSVMSNTITHVRPQEIQARSLGRPVGFSEGVIFDGERSHTPNDFFSSEANSNVLVLTYREMAELKSLVFTSNISAKIRALELEFPVLKNIKNVDRFINYQEMIRILGNIKRLGLRQEKLSSQISNKMHKRSVRKLRKKSNLDDAFAFLADGTISEPYILMEPRQERLVYALDFNSMYPSCMLSRYCNPGDLSYHGEPFIITKDSASFRELRPGVYNVELVNAQTEFIKTFSPLTINFFDKKYPIQLSGNKVYKATISRDELIYYLGHFESIVVTECVTSNSYIDHPLKATVKRLYNKRLKSSGMRARIIKFELALLHSMTRRKKQTEVKISTESDLKKYLECNFHFFDNLPEEYLEMLHSSSFASESRVKDDQLIYVFKHTGVIKKSSVQCLYFETLAKSRVKLLTMMEKIFNTGYSEICYANVDSVHVSIPDNRKKDFESELSFEAGVGLGELKVEAIGKNGFWLAPGRYWITDEHGIVKFANSYFNHPGATSSIIEERTRPHFFNYKGIRWIENSKLKVNNSMFSKKIIRILAEESLIRFEKHRGATFMQTHETLINEKYKNKDLRNQITRYIIQKLNGLGDEVPT